MDGSYSAGGDDRTFRVNCNDEGASRLRERVKEKLKEFREDYDDTLAEYVVVLLRNGKRKDDARRELNVFLGNDSVPFVSWLWEHLSCNLHMYVQPKEASPDKVDKINPTRESFRRHHSQTEQSGNVQIDSEKGGEMSTRLSGSRRNREWKGLVQETELFPLQSTVTEIFHSEMNSHDQPNLVTRSRSPVRQVHRKRSRQDGQPMKRDTASHPSIGAPRRLLQFAVRDAVKTVQQSSSRAEPPSKRICSGVSMSTTNSVLNGRSLRMRSAARVPGLSTALKAAAEAAEDVVKVRYSRSVFDRSEHGMVNVDPINQSSGTRTTVLEDGECENFDQLPGSNGVDYYQRSSYDGHSTGNITMLDRDSGIASDSSSDNDRYGDVDIVRRALDVSQSASSVNKDNGSMKLQYSVAQDADKISRETRLMDQDPSTSAAGQASSKVVNISVNVNTWKPSQYQAPMDVIEVENEMAVDKNEVSAGKPNVRLPKENDTAVAENKNVIASTDVQKESQRTVASTSGSYTTNPSEDIDSRTVFVSNVHFAATKDTLSRHFNKFGEVLKVIIVTDAPTGQPKGSAYVEFLRKESAELALSLNGTSFMSRALKVVRRSYHEAGPMFGWPRSARSSSFTSRLTRMTFSRSALAGPFRARLPVKTGARSLQWKRGASTPQTSEGTHGPQNSSLTSGNDALSLVGTKD